MSLDQKTGFTVLEICIVIALIGVLSSLAVTNYINMQEDANKAATMKAMFEIKVIIRGDPTLNNHTGYLADMDRYPNDLSELRHQGSQPDYNPFKKKGWRGPYINPKASHFNEDAWGTPFVYNNTQFTITSCGPDKSCSYSNAQDNITFSMTQSN